MRYTLLIFSLMVTPYCLGVVNFIDVIPISLTENEGITVFEFREKGTSYVQTLHISRRPECLSNGNNPGKGTEEEYQRAKVLLAQRVEAGKEFEFGLNSLSIPNKTNHLWAVNLKIFAPNSANPIIWSVNSDVGDNHCTHKGS